MIKTINTVYAGFRFRSRLEARWAVFFDALKIPYEYEKEGYDLGKAGWYLPDFWLPSYDVWVEIKPYLPTPTSAEWQKASFLVSASGKDLFMLTQPWLPVNDDFVRFEFYKQGDLAWARPRFRNRWAECPRCGYVSMWPESGGKCPQGNCQVNVLPITVKLQAATGRILQAYTVARQARFEHREMP